MKHMMKHGPGIETLTAGVTSGRAKKGTVEVVVSTSAWYPVVRGSIPVPGMFQYCVNLALNIIEIVYLCVFRRRH